MATPQGSWYVIGEISWAGKDGAFEEKSKIFNRYSTTSYRERAMSSRRRHDDLTDRKGRATMAQ